MSDKVVRLGAKRDKKELKEAKDKEESSSNEQKEILYCSFCKRPSTKVIKMVQGPGVNICSECTMIAVQYLILEDKMLSSEAKMILDTFWGKSR